MTWPAKKGPYRAQKNAKTAEKLTNLVFHKNCFFHNSAWNWWGLGVSGGRAWTIRRHCLELWQGSVLHGIGKSTFQHLTVNWKVASWQNTSKLVVGSPLKPGASGWTAFGENPFWKMSPPKKRETGKPSNFVKMATVVMPFYCFFVVQTKGCVSVTTCIQGNR